MKFAKEPVFSGKITSIPESPNNQTWEHKKTEENTYTIND